MPKPSRSPPPTSHDRQRRRPTPNKSRHEAAKEAAKLAKEAEAAALTQKQASEAVTAREPGKPISLDRSASMKDGKPEWGEKHKMQHAYFVQTGGVKRTRGRRPNEPETTRQGILVPLMDMRLIDLDAKAIATWLEKEAAQAPAATALAFRHLRAFITWCAKNDKYKSVAHSDACQSEDVKKKVPSSKPKKNDSMRSAQIRPWFESVQKIGNPVIAAYLQCLLLTGHAAMNCRTTLEDVDFQWKSLTIRDKVEGERTIPLTPYVEYLISALPRRNEFVLVVPQPLLDVLRSRVTLTTKH